MATLKIIAFRVALRFALALHRFASAVVDAVIAWPDDATFDAEAKRHE